MYENSKNQQILAIVAANGAISDAELATKMRLSPEDIKQEVTTHLSCESLFRTGDGRLGSRLGGMMGTVNSNLWDSSLQL